MRLPADRRAAADGASTASPEDPVHALGDRTGPGDDGRRLRLIVSLADKLHASIVWDAFLPSAFGEVEWKTDTTIVVPPPRDQLAALTALHELAHLALHKDALVRLASADIPWAGNPDFARYELEAWDSAIALLQEPLEYDTLAGIVNALRTYVGRPYPQ